MTGVSPAIKPGLPAQAVVLANRSTYLNTEFLLQSGARFLNRSAPGKRRVEGSAAPSHTTFYLTFWKSLDQWLLSGHFGNFE